MRASLAGVSGTSGSGTSSGSAALSFPAPLPAVRARHGSGTVGGKTRSPSTSVAAGRSDCGSASSSKLVCIPFVDSAPFSVIRLQFCWGHLLIQEKEISETECCLALEISGNLFCSSQQGKAPHLWLLMLF